MSDTITSVGNDSTTVEVTVATAAPETTAAVRPEAPLSAQCFAEAVLSDVLIKLAYSAGLHQAGDPPLAPGVAASIETVAESGLLPGFFTEIALDGIRAEANAVAEEIDQSAGPLTQYADEMNSGQGFIPLHVPSYPIMDVVSLISGGCQPILNACPGLSPALLNIVNLESTDQARLEGFLGAVSTGASPTACS